MGLFTRTQTHTHTHTHAHIHTHTHARLDWKRTLRIHPYNGQCHEIWLKVNNLQSLTLNNSVFTVIPNSSVAMLCACAQAQAHKHTYMYTHVRLAILSRKKLII